MFTFEIENFDLRQIAESGQCFRMNRISDRAGAYSVISRGRYAELFQEGREVTISCQKKDLEFWRHYFDMDRDYGYFISSVSREDQYLQQAASAGSGIRILNQDPWEMIITFILSQQKTIPLIKAAVERLCALYGTERTVLLPKLDENSKNPSTAALASRTYFDFPEASRLCQASLTELQTMKLGYRAKYIHRICDDCAAGRLDLARLMGHTYEEAMDYLTGFYGIGVKVANCICLFSLHHINAFPVDTWIERILLTHYNDKRYENLPKNRLYQTMIEEHFGRYKSYGGVMQQYIFYYERSVVNEKSV